MQLHSFTSVLALGLVVVAACSDDAATSSSSGGNNTSSSSSGGSSSGGSSSGGSSSGGSSSGGSSSGGQTDSGAGPTCAAYCATVAAKCTAADAQYASDADCMKACTGMPVGTAADTSGNTLGCRSYHANNTPAATHCAHGNPFGGRDGQAICGDRCDGFCDLAAVACATTFADKATCKTQCNTWLLDGTNKEFGKNGPTGGNTFNCRSYHLMAAISAPSPHCGHIVTASPTCTN